MRPRKSTTDILVEATSNPYIPACFFSLAGLATLAAYTVDHWLDPFWTVLIGALVVVPVTLAITLLLNPQLRGDWTDNDELHVIVTLVFAIGGVVPWIWSVPQVRTAYLGHLGSGEAYAAAMWDRSSRVRQRACRYLVGRSDSMHAVKAVLADRPRVAQECLADIAPNPRGKRLAVALADHWKHGIVHGYAADAGERCVEARILPFMPVEDRQSASILLDCVLRTSSSEVRECCTQAARRSFGQCGGVLSRVAPSRLRASNAVGPLVGVAFGQEDIAERLGSAVAELDLTCTRGQWFAVKLLCDAVQRSGASRQDRLFFGWLMNRHAACLPKGERGIEAGVERICGELMSRVDPSNPPDGAICRARRSARRKKAVARRDERETSGDRADLASRIAVGADRVSRAQRSGGSGAGGAGSQGSRSKRARACLTESDIAWFKARLGRMAEQLGKADGRGLAMGLRGGAGGASRLERTLMRGGNTRTAEKRRRLLECIRHGAEDCPVEKILDRPRCKSSSLGLDGPRAPSSRDRRVTL